MSQTKNWNFTLFFNYKDEQGKRRAEEWRNDSSIYLREVFGRVARFSTVAKEKSTTSLRLRGFVSMKNACTQPHVKKILGKFSHCHPAPFGDVINLIQCFNIDKQTVLTGKLATNDVDVKFVMRVMREKTERERAKSSIKATTTEGIPRIEHTHTTERKQTHSGC